MSGLQDFDQKYRWERLEGEKGRLQNLIFGNDNLSVRKRKSILTRLHCTQTQRQFLLNAWDIDWLAVKNKKPFLIEEKSVGIKRLTTNSLRVTCGLPSQPKTLQKAADLGIKTGVLVNFKSWGALGPTPKGVIRRHLGYDDGTRIVLSKIYYWGESAFPSGQKIKIVDKFVEMANNFAK